MDLCDYTGHPAIPTLVRMAITYDQTDYPDRVVEVGRFPLVVTTVIEKMRVTKILMDGGSGINILYKDAFDKLNVE